MSGHTPGPWTVVRPPMDQNAYDVYGDGAQITRGYWAHNAGADAYLIAAAPDLLKAALLAVSVLGHMAEILGDVEQEPGTVIPQLRAAIAKAEGR